MKNSWGAGWGESGYFKIAYSELGTVVNFGDYTIRYTGSACSYSRFPEQSVPEPAGRFRQRDRHDAERLRLDGRKQRRLDHGHLGSERDGERDGELFSSAEHGR